MDVYAPHYTEIERERETEGETVRDLFIRQRFNSETQYRSPLLLEIEEFVARNGRRRLLDIFA